MPSVSVIMGVYNGSSCVEKAIESIINQTYTDWELVICDDGSSDGTLEKLLKYKEKDKRICVISNKSNKGLAVTLNNCLKHSQGKYIARMDDDDYSHSDRLMREVEFLETHSQYDIVSTSRNMVDEKGIWGNAIDYGEKTKIDIFKGDFFAHPTVMIRKEAYDKVSGYSIYKGIGREEDTDLWCKMYCAGSKGFVLDEILLDYYESRNSMNRRKFKYRFAETKIKLNYMRKLGIPMRYLIYAFKPIVVGLIPNFAMAYLHHKRYSKEKLNES